MAVNMVCFHGTASQGAQVYLVSNDEQRSRPMTHAFRRWCFADACCPARPLQSAVCEAMCRGIRAICPLQRTAKKHRLKEQNTNRRSKIQIGLLNTRKKRGTVSQHHHPHRPPVALCVACPPQGRVALIIQAAVGQRGPPQKRPHIGVCPVQHRVYPHKGRPTSTAGAPDLLVPSVWVAPEKANNKGTMGCGGALCVAACFCVGACMYDSTCMYEGDSTRR